MQLVTRKRRMLTQVREKVTRASDWFSDLIKIFNDDILNISSN